MLRTIAKKKFIPVQLIKPTMSYCVSITLKHLFCERVKRSLQIGGMVRRGRNLSRVAEWTLVMIKKKLIPHYFIKTANLLDYKLTEQKLTWVINAISKLFVHPTTLVIIIMYANSYSAITLQKKITMALCQLIYTTFILRWSVHWTNWCWASQTDVGVTHNIWTRTIGSKTSAFANLTRSESWWYHWCMN